MDAANSHPASPFLPSDWFIDQPFAEMVKGFFLSDNMTICHLE